MGQAGRQRKRGDEDERPDFPGGAYHFRVLHPLGDMPLHAFAQVA